MSGPAERYQGADGNVYRVHRTGPDDTTPIQLGAGYDSRCGLCWLNISHSEAAHAQQLDGHAAQLEAVRMSADPEPVYVVVNTDTGDALSPAYSTHDEARAEMFRQYPATEPWDGVEVPVAITEAGPVRILTCCCCGAGARGRQWWNRDTGFGLCARCADWITERHPGEDMPSLYGHRGVHYDLQDGAA